MAEQEEYSKTIFVDSEDLLTEMLKRLPVKSLCRLRCVCKSWNSLLSSTRFIGLQYKFSADTQTPSEQKRYILTDSIAKCRIQQCTLYDPQKPPEHGRFTFINMPYPKESVSESKSGCVCLAIAGVIQGVVCLTSRSKVVVWNPTTNRHLIFHHHKYYDDGVLSSGFGFGFGFDAAKKDFKVVVVVSPPTHGRQHYDVLSVQDGCWRRGSLPDQYTNWKIVSNSCFLNGTIYWIATSTATLENKEPLITDQVVLLLFECEREEFSTMKLELEFMDDDKHMLEQRHLFIYSGMLAVVRSDKEFRRISSTCELWGMEQGGSGVWNMLCCVRVHSGRYSTKPGGPPPELYLPRILPNNQLGQPLASLLLEETLFLMDVNPSGSDSDSGSDNHPSTALRCKYCYTNDRWSKYCHKTSYGVSLCKILQI